jgi:hypothetical protein
MASSLPTAVLAGFATKEQWEIYKNLSFANNNCSIDLKDMKYDQSVFNNLHMKSLDSANDHYAIRWAFESPDVKTATTTTGPWKVKPWSLHDVKVAPARSVWNKARKTVDVIGKGLRTGPSAIKGAGRGLIANRDFKKGGYITEFNAARISPSGVKALLKLEPKSDALRYIATTVSQHEFLLARLTPEPGFGGAQFANRTTRELANAERVTVEWDVHKTVILKAKKDIPKGTEILWEYGTGAFEAHHGPTEKETKTKRKRDDETETTEKKKNKTTATTTTKSIVMIPTAVLCLVFTYLWKKDRTTISNLSRMFRDTSRLAEALPLVLSLGGTTIVPSYAYHRYCTTVIMSNAASTYSRSRDFIKTLPRLTRLVLPLRLSKYSLECKGVTSVRFIPACKCHDESHCNHFHVVTHAHMLWNNYPKLESLDVGNSLLSLGQLRFLPWTLTSLRGNVYTNLGEVSPISVLLLPSLTSFDNTRAQDHELCNTVSRCCPNVTTLKLKGWATSLLLLGTYGEWPKVETLELESQGAGFPTQKNVRILGTSLSFPALKSLRLRGCCYSGSSERVLISRSLEVDHTKLKCWKHRTSDSGYECMKAQLEKADVARSS